MREQIIKNKNFLFSQVKSAFIARGMAVGLLATWVLAACSQLQTRHEVDMQMQKNTDSAKSSGSGKSLDLDQNTAVPTKTAKKVALILGPGGYKAFAHAGVIKELRKHNVPINKIVGLEWGALVAGLYAQRGQVNEAEWKLYKLEKLDLDSTGFFNRKKEMKSIRELDDYLKQNLEAKDVSQATVPFFCPSLLLNQGVLSWQDSGAIVSIVRNCLPYPPLFRAEQPIVAGLFSLNETVERLKSEGYSVIIFVNVLGDGNLFDNSNENEDYATTIVWNEARRAIAQAKGRVTDVIEVSTRGISMGDFSSRKFLVTAGEAAGEKAGAAIADKYGF